jgi:hypothetical protein
MEGVPNCGVAACSLTITSRVWFVVATDDPAHMREPSSHALRD